MTLSDPIYVIVDGHAVPDLSSTQLCACGQPTGSPNRPTCRACLHAEIAANTARLKAAHPELFSRGSRIKGWRDKRYHGV